jgi:biopolymer transport protein ExbD
MEKPIDIPTDESLPQTAGGFTAPLGLLNHLKRPEIKLDIVPVLDLIVIALLISLLFTRFVMLPGVRVDLPATDLRMQHNDSPVAVLTIGNKGMLYFDGSVYEQTSIAKAFREHVQGALGKHVLLVKAQATMELQLFLDLCRMAQEAGFVQVQLAGEKVEKSLDFIPVDALRESSNVLLPVM